MKRNKSILEVEEPVPGSWGWRDQVWKWTGGGTECDSREVARLGSRSHRSSSILGTESQENGMPLEIFKDNNMVRHLFIYLFINWRLIGFFFFFFFKLRSITQHCEDNELKKPKVEAGRPVHSYLVDWARNGNSGVRMTHWRRKQFLETKTYLGGRTCSTYR